MAYLGAGQRTSELAAARHGHAAAYHGVRLPAYLVLTAWGALVGIVRTIGHLLAWRYVPDLHKLERQPPRTGCCPITCASTGGPGCPHRPGLILTGCAVVMVVLSAPQRGAWGL
jgi:hypothetical protein